MCAFLHCDMVATFFDDSTLFGGRSMSELAYAVRMRRRSCRYDSSLNVVVSMWALGKVRIRRNLNRYVHGSWETSGIM